MIKPVSNAVLFIFMLHIISCGNSTDSVTPDVTQEKISSGIIGIVTDREGNALEGVTVQSEQLTRITAQNGSFTFGSQSVPSEGFIIRFSKTGYFPCIKRVKSENGMVHSTIALAPLALADIITPTEHDTVQKSRHTLYFVKNSIVKNSGENFSGLAACYLDIIDGLNGGFLFSANGNGFIDNPTESGFQKNIFTSIVHFRITLADESGKELSIEKGKDFVLKATIPQQLIATAPIQCALWRYDEAAAHWVRHGNALKDETGMYYSALLDRTGTWMIAHEDKVAYVQGTVDCGGMPSTGLLVNVGQGLGITDINGRYKISVPVGRQIIAVVDRALNGGLTAPARSLTVEAENGTSEMNMTLQVCGAELSGAIVDCSDKPASGMLIVKANNGYFTTRAILQDGKFRITVPPNVPLLVSVRGLNGYNSTELNIESLEKSMKKDVGMLKVCVP